MSLLVEFELLPVPVIRELKSVGSATSPALKTIPDPSTGILSSLPWGILHHSIDTGSFWSSGPLYHTRLIQR